MMLRFKISGRQLAHSGGAVSHQRGATVIELVLYLAGAVILLVAVFGLFGSGTQAARTRTESSNIQALIATVNRFYGTNRDFPNGQFGATLAAADAVPASMKNGNSNSLRNQFGGEAQVFSPDGVSFTLVETNLPKAACIELAQLPLNPQVVSINTSPVAVPVAAPIATTACSQAVNRVDWNFR